MATTFRVVALSLLDIEGTDLRGEPELSYPEALTLSCCVVGRVYRRADGGSQTLRAV
jgi:hypothetical protein